MPVDRVQKIVRSLVLHAVPGSSAHLLGLAQYGGEPLAVLDLEAMLDGGAKAGGGRGQRMTIVVRAGAEQATETVGLAVDDAIQVITLNDKDLRPTGPGLAVAEALIGDALVTVVDLQGLAGEG